jgi:hypothetical protein
MDETNFVDYIKDSDKGEYHCWRRVTSTDEKEEDVQFPNLVQRSIVVFPFHSFSFFLL